MLKNIIYSIAKEFTDVPGPRKKSEGKYSGELFRETILIPKFQEARTKSVKLIIDLDGTFGYPPSFLDEAFGGLVEATKLKRDEILKTLVIHSSRPVYIEKIRHRMSLWEMEHLR